MTRHHREPSGLGLTLHHEQYSKVEREEHGFSIKGFVLLLIEALTNPFYLTAIALLILVTFIGKSSGGSQRWIDLRFFDLQPSELAKLLVPIAMARYLADHEDTLDHLRHLLVTLVQVAIPMLIIARQPDLGTALTLGATWLGMVILAGVQWRHLFWYGCCGCGKLSRHVDPFSDRLSARTASHLPQSAARSARRGLQHHPIADQRRRGRLTWTWPQQRHAEPVALSARAAYRLYFLGAE